jgi:hypothetical protein
MSRANTIEDLFANIDTKGGDDTQCWPWQGGASSLYKDRPYFQYEGQRWLAYRLMYTLVNGPIPEGKVIRHLCDNSLCCNPKHLMPGTKSENENDKYQNDRAGLPVAVVREIKRLLQTTNATQQTIAEYVSQRYNYNVSRSAVRNIKLGLRRTTIDKARTAGEIAGFTLQSEDGDSGSNVEEDTDTGQVDTEATD